MKCTILTTSNRETQELLLVVPFQILLKKQFIFQDGISGLINCLCCCCNHYFGRQLSNISVSILKLSQMMQKYLFVSISSGI